MLLESAPPREEEGCTKPHGHGRRLRYPRMRTRLGDPAASWARYTTQSKITRHVGALSVLRLVSGLRLRLSLCEVYEFASVTSEARRLKC